MPAKKQGNPFPQLQPGWTIDEDENGLLTGEMSWEGDWAFRFATRPVGSQHPYDWRLTAHRSRMTRLATDKFRLTLSYVGLKMDPTPWIIDHPGGSGQEPIETHPDFKTIAGTKTSPLNGAKFDATTGEFIGFVDPNNTLCGTRAYIVPSVIINATHYTHYTPNLGSVGRITSTPPIQIPRNVRNFLLIGTPYKQIGNVYQVTYQYLGSGPNGWHSRIY